MKLDAELQEVLDSRELRSQHRPTTLSKHETVEEQLWTYHDGHHGVPFTRCLDCSGLRQYHKDHEQFPAHVMRFLSKRG